MDGITSYPTPCSGVDESCPVLGPLPATGEVSDVVYIRLDLVLF